jgi:hypothetical protein
MPSSHSRSQSVLSCSLKLQRSRSLKSKHVESVVVCGSKSKPNGGNVRCDDDEIT